MTTRRPTLPTLLLASLLVTAATPLVASAAATCHPRKGCSADSAPADDPVTSPVTIAAPGDGTARPSSASYVATPTTPAVDWDGVHVFLRYRGPQELYYVSVDRRDDRIVVKKKVPGGSSNGGTYHTLATATLRNGHGTWRDLEARVVINGDGSVTLSLSTAGMTVLRTTDTGTGGPPITEPGRVGIRGDNTEFRLRDWTVTRVHG